MLFPTRQWGGVDHGQLTWKPLGTGRVLAVLHNPTYAGAYAYGRSHSQIQALPDQNQRLVKHTRRLNNPEEWTSLLRDTHPGYITWEQFLRNRQRLDDNRSRLEDLQQKAELLSEPDPEQASGASWAQADAGVRAAEVEVAFLREKQRRARS